MLSSWKLPALHTGWVSSNPICAMKLAKLGRCLTQSRGGRMRSFQLTVEQGESMARVADHMTPAGTLPKDGTSGALAGRVWLPDAGGPAVVAVRADGVYDISRLAPTMRDLCEADDPAAIVRDGKGERIGALADDPRQHAGRRSRCEASPGCSRPSTCRPSRPPASPSRCRCWSASSRSRRAARRRRPKPSAAACRPSSAATSARWCPAARRRPSSSAC